MDRLDGRLETTPHILLDGLQRCIDFVASLDVWKWLTENSQITTYLEELCIPFWLSIWFRKGECRATKVERSGPTIQQLETLSGTASLLFWYRCHYGTKYTIDWFAKIISFVECLRNCEANGGEYAIAKENVSRRSRSWCRRGHPAVHPRLLFSMELRGYFVDWEDCNLTRFQRMLSLSFVSSSLANKSICLAAGSSKLLDMKSHENKRWCQNSKPRRGAFSTGGNLPPPPP